ncbi:MAG TPA: HD domain-containing phosphohydrolase [Rhizobacter sp.]|nr:HD domain-containing phosphohydrolase [Rhizobacter sp.]
MDSKKPLADPAFMYLADDDWSADKSLSYRQLVEQAQTGMFIVQDEMLTYANPKLLEMVGYTKDKLVNVRKASAIVHPKDRARFEDQVRQRFAGVAGVPYEVQCERADGSTFEARVYGRLVTYDGRVADLITLADVTELTQATEKLKRSYLTSIKVFSNLVELRGGQLAGHGRRVGDLARALAEAVECTTDETEHIFVAGLLHDIGMIGLSDASIEKSIPKMSAPELAAYKQHAAWGEQSLMALEDLQPAARLIRSHHERFDGAGFPDALRGEDIPLGARILAIADSYDDLIKGHMGGVPLKSSEAKAMLVRGKGVQFDPGLVDVFIRINPDIPESAPASPPLILGTDELRAGMVLAADLVSPTGVLMLPAEHVLSLEMIKRIKQYEQRERTQIGLMIRNKG